MAYKYEDRLYANSVVQSTTENMFIETGETKEIKEVYKKAKAFDHIKVIYDKNMNEMSISDTECIEMIGNELEGADD